MRAGETREVVGDEPIALYRLYDAGGALLYVGITHSPAKRFAQHAEDKPWWGQVARKTICWHDGRRAAEQAETEAIQSESPHYNVTHGTHPPNLLGSSGGPGRRTSIYLPDELHAAWKASGMSLSRVLREGITAPSPEKLLARRTAELATEAVRENLREIVRSEIRAALYEASGGAWDAGQWMT